MKVVVINCDLPLDHPDRKTVREQTPEERGLGEVDKATATERLKEEQAAEAQRSKDVAALKARANTDPDFAALVRLLRLT